MNTNDYAPVKTYSKEQLSTMYGIHTKTLRKWLESHDEGLKELGYQTRSKLVFPRIVRYIFEHFGYPDIEDYNKAFTKPNN